MNLLMAMITSYDGHWLETCIILMQVYAELGESHSA